MYYMGALLLAGGLTEYIRWRCRSTGRWLDRWPNNTRKNDKAPE